MLLAKTTLANWWNISLFFFSLYVDERTRDNLKKKLFRFPCRPSAACTPHSFTHPVRVKFVFGGWRMKTSQHPKQTRWKNRKENFLLFFAFFLCVFNKHKDDGRRKTFRGWIFVSFRLFTHYNSICLLFFFLCFLNNSRCAPKSTFSSPAGLSRVAFSNYKLGEITDEDWTINDDHCLIVDVPATNSTNNLN